MQFAIGTEFLPSYVDAFQNNLIVPSGEVVELSGPDEIDAIEVHGTLRIQADLRYVNLVIAPGGLLEIGLNPATITKKDVPLDTNFDPYQWGHGVICLGKIIVQGQPIETPWIRLSEPLLAGQSTIETLTPTGWQEGDEIAVPATIFAAGKLYEHFVITAIEDTVIGLDHPAVFDHLNAVDYDLVTPAKSTNGEPLNAHACNLTRTITFRSENPNGVRGHFVATGHAGVDIRYARFKDMGRTTIANLDSTSPDQSHIGTNQIGRYSVHLHHVHGLDTVADPEDYPGKPLPQFRLIGNVVTGDSKWGMSIHGSHYGLIKNNISQSNGAGFVTEDGSESYNVFQKNFAYGSPGDGSLDRYDPQGRRGAGFWLRGTHNYFYGNVGAASQEGFGFYLAIIGRPIPEDNVRIPLFPGAHIHTEGEYQAVKIANLPLLGFEGNESYGHRQQGVGCWLLQLTYPTFSNTTIWRCEKAIHLDYSSGLFDGLVVRQCGIALDTHHPNSQSGKPLHLRNYDVQDVTSMTKEDDRPLLNGLFEDGVAAATQPMVIGSAQQGYSPRKYLFRRSRFLPVGNAPLKAIETRLDSRWSRGGSYVVFVSSKIDVRVEDYQGVPGDDFRIWFKEQKPDHVLSWPEPTTILSHQIPAGVLLTVEKGLTSSENWEKYASGPLMELAPANTTTRPEITGIIEGSEVEPPPPPEVWEPATIDNFNGDATLRVRNGLIEKRR